VLNIPPAVQTSVKVVRAFVRLGAMLASNKELARRRAQLGFWLDKNSPATLRPSPRSYPPSVS